MDEKFSNLASKMSRCLDVFSREVSDLKRDVEGDIENFHEKVEAVVESLVRVEVKNLVSESQVIDAQSDDKREETVHKTENEEQHKILTVDVEYIDDLAMEMEMAPVHVFKDFDKNSCKSTREGIFPPQRTYSKNVEEENEDNGQKEKLKRKFKNSKVVVTIQEAEDIDVWKGKNNCYKSCERKKRRRRKTFSKKRHRSKCNLITEEFQCLWTKEEEIYGETRKEFYPLEYGEPKELRYKKENQEEETVLVPEVSEAVREATVPGGTNSFSRGCCDDPGGYRNVLGGSCSVRRECHSILGGNRSVPGGCRSVPGGCRSVLGGSRSFPRGNCSGTGGISGVSDGSRSSWRNQKSLRWKL